MLPDHLREFSDARTARKWIFDNTLEGVSKRFPIEDEEYKLELIDPKFANEEEYDYEKQKRSLLRRGRLTTPLRGTWRLTHKPTGSVLDEREDVVMQVPYLTPRGTFIIRGNEYGGSSQSRLKFGVYTRFNARGEPEADFNIEPGTGRRFKVQLAPDTGEFSLHVGQSKAPLYPLLRILGVSDQELKDAWGEGIVAKNARNLTPSVMNSFRKNFIKKFNEDPLLSPEDNLRKVLSEYKVNPKVVARTLGIESENLTPAMLTRTTQKLLNVLRHEEEPDDANAPLFSSVLSYEDLIRERIDKDAGRLAQDLFRKARWDKTLKRVPFAALNPYIDNYISGSRLVSPLEETNPIHTLDQMTRVVKTGEGGIGSHEAITDAARNVNLGQLGFIDPVASSESISIGADLRFAYKTYKGKDQQVYGEFNDVKTGEKVYLNPADVYDKTLAFPGEDLSNPKNIVSAARGGKFVNVPAAEVDIQVPSASRMFAHGLNMIPMPTGMMPGRSFYGSKYWSQFMPLQEGEVPYIATALPDSSETFLEYYGKKTGCITSPMDGVVEKVTDNQIVVRGSDKKKHTYNLVKDLPFNRITGCSFFPSVEPGDVVQPGSILAHSNFTDKKTGSINMGRNLKALVTPGRGSSFEDAYVISETAAKKLTTQGLFGFDLETKHGIESGKNKYISLFPKNFTTDQIDKINANGVVKKGTILQPGDPIILGIGPKLLTAEDAVLGRLHKALRSAHTDKSVIWESEYPGEVVDTEVVGNSIVVNVKADIPVRVGDKLTTSQALKGVIGDIVPDDKMPRDIATNEPYEVIINPMGVLSRVSPNQIIMIELAKLAKQTGQQLRLPSEAPPEGWAAWAKAKLEEHGITRGTSAFDPISGKAVEGLGDGFAYIQAFHHLADKKLSTRGSGSGYTADGLPARGSSEVGAAKRFGSMNVNAALSHGATEVIRDVINIRGNKNEEFWKALKMGRPLPEPEVPFIYNKFINLLKAGGINVRDQGDVTSLLPMTDKDITHMSVGPISSSQMVDKNFAPVPGGLFDPGKTGGLAGNFWSHIQLDEPVPNPVFEEPIRRILGLTQRELEDVVSGTSTLDGATGGAAIRKALSKIDIQSEIDKQKDLVTKLRGSNRDNAVKVIGYLETVKAQGLHPADWTITRVPVLPPIFRPLSKLGDVTLEADINELYRDLIESNEQTRMVSQELGYEGAAEERLTLYDSIKAAYGLGKPITQEGRAKGLQGAIRQIIGDRPKTGLMQAKVLSKPVDVVGRGVIVPDKNMDMDSIGIPVDSAWQIYAPFIMRRLVTRGYSPEHVMELIKNRGKEAEEALHLEMQSRPVIADRAPAWHKFNMLAFYPHITRHNVVRISPLVVSGFNADFDGDQMNFHVPVSDKAVKEAYEKMLPSKNLTSLTDLKSIRHPLSKEFSLGLYALTRNPSKKPVTTFRTAAEAKEAYRRGLIKANDPIRIVA